MKLEAEEVRGELQGGLGNSFLGRGKRKCKPQREKELELFLESEGERG